MTATNRETFQENEILNMPDLSQVTVVIVHYNTPDLLREAVESFRTFYRSVALTIIDNGSDKEKLEEVRQFTREDTRIQIETFEQNRYHGPAMDWAMRNLDSDFLFFLDSDTITRKGGFLEKMQNHMALSDMVYGVGKRSVVDDRGFRAESGHAILQTPYMLLRREIYPRLDPFEHKGMPTLANFRSAVQYGYRINDFPIDDFIHHLGRGTAERFGYGLGLRGKLNYLMHKLGL
jgi:GT2 family glycosyltransferase